VALNRSPSLLEFSETLLGVYSTFDRSMILFEKAIQVLGGSADCGCAASIHFYCQGSRL